MLVIHICEHLLIEYLLLFLHLCMENKNPVAHVCNLKFKKNFSSSHTNNQNEELYDPDVEGMEYITNLGVWQKQTYL